MTSPQADAATTDGTTPGDDATGGGTGDATVGGGETDDGGETDGDDTSPCELDRFGAATTVDLPDLSALQLQSNDPARVLSVGDNRCANDRFFRFTTTDLTADGRPDFVITDACDDGGVGLERWIVHPAECR